MPDGSSDRFSCPNCRKQFKWKPDLSSKKVRCSGCEQKFRIPEAPGRDAEAIGPPPPKKEDSADMYELDLPDHEAKAPQRQKSFENTGKCPNCNSDLNPDAVICLNCGFNLAEGEVMDTMISASPAAEAGPAATAAAVAAADGRPIGGAFAAAAVRKGISEEGLAEDAHKSHIWTNLYLPLILIGVSAVLLVIVAVVSGVLWAGPQNTGNLVTVDIAASLIGYAITLVIQLPFFFIGLLLVAKIFGSSFGGLFSAILKLFAVAVLVMAGGEVSRTLIYLMTGGLSVFGVELMITWGVQFLVFWGACVKLFDMDPLEIVVLFICVIFLPIIAAVFLLSVLMSILFS